MVAWARRNPGLALLALAVAAAIALYAPTLGRGLVNYDDPWLVRDNWIVHHPSLASLRAIAFDLSPDTRFVLGAEYLPVRDVSIMFDCAVWGDAYSGFHLTNLVLYLASIGLWFYALDALGIDRCIAGLAVLLWAVHPSHAESVAWITERKGLLACMFAGAATLGYARFRAGRSARWLGLAVACAICAVWSKAPAAFAIAALAGLELVVPAARRSWRRSLVGLGAIALASLAAVIPVVLVAVQTNVVGGGDQAPAGAAAMALGLHGFYLELASAAIRNAPSYAIGTLGPSTFEIALGALGLVAAIAIVAVPARGRFRPPPALRAAGVIWLASWLPASRLVLPLHAVLVADRYVLIATLGIALAAAAGIMRIAKPGVRAALVAVLVLAAGLRTLDAQANWRDAATLWERAVTSNPDDGEAWSMYAEALTEAGDLRAADAAVAEGLAHDRAPRLVARQALIAIARGERAEGVRLMREAAVREPRAMSNLALLLLDDGQLDEALAHATRGADAMPFYAPAHRALGKVLLAAQHPDRALVAFARALQLEPQNLANRYNRALALIALHRPDEARSDLEACLGDRALGARARDALLALDRGPAR